MISPSRSTLLPTVTFSSVPGASDTGYAIGQKGKVLNADGTSYTVYQYLGLDGTGAVWREVVHTNENGNIVGPRFVADDPLALFERGSVATSIEPGESSETIHAKSDPRTENATLLNITDASFESSITTEDGARTINAFGRQCGGASAGWFAYTNTGSGTDIYRTPDGDTWTKIATIATETATNKNLIVAATDDTALVFITDAAEVWRVTSDGGSALVVDELPYWVGEAIDADGNGRWVYGTYSSDNDVAHSVYESTDDGVSWTTAFTPTIANSGEVGPHWHSLRYMDGELWGVTGDVYDSAIYRSTTAAAADLALVVAKNKLKNPSTIRRLATGRYALGVHWLNNPPFEIDSDGVATSRRQIWRPNGDSTGQTNSAEWAGDHLVMSQNDMGDNEIDVGIAVAETPEMNDASVYARLDGSAGGDDINRTYYRARIGGKLYFAAKGHAEVVVMSDPVARGCSGRILAPAITNLDPGSWGHVNTYYGTVTEETVRGRTAYKITKGDSAKLMAWSNGHRDDEGDAIAVSEGDVVVGNFAFTLAATSDNLKAIDIRVHLWDGSDWDYHLASSRISFAHHVPGNHWVDARVSAVIPAGYTGLRYQIEVWDEEGGMDWISYQANITKDSLAPFGTTEDASADGLTLPFRAPTEYTMLLGIQPLDFFDWPNATADRYIASIVADSDNHVEVWYDGSEEKFAVSSTTEGSETHIRSAAQAYLAHQMVWIAVEVDSSNVTARLANGQALEDITGGTAVAGLLDADCRLVYGDNAGANGMAMRMCTALLFPHTMTDAELTAAIDSYCGSSTPPDGARPLLVANP